MKFEESTDIIAKMLSEAGVRHVVASSGSRSLRMVRAAVDNGALNVRMVVDERVAAFSALGISDCLNEPVALICTSGSAMLNYGPAISEAYYRGIPLIAITADRPVDVIDINDGQTIHQNHALDNIVKASLDIDATKPCSKEALDAVKHVISAALSPRKGPVHINLHLEEGNEALTYESIDYEVVAEEPIVLNPEPTLSSMNGAEFSDKKILIFLGQMPFDRETADLAVKLSRKPNVVIVADIVSNCSGGDVITDIEPIAGRLKESPDTYAPDLLITLGKTSPISRRFKEWLRSLKGYSHWRVNDKAEPEDTYYHLDRTVVSDDKAFLEFLDNNIPDSNHSTYNKVWFELYRKASAVKAKLLVCAPWSDVAAINIVAERMPENYDIQCSNGMSIRYLSMIGINRHRLQANRGVNGIDGSTSTAIGYSTVSYTPTLFITGDMSAVYDISALYSGQLTPKFKMVIIANKGGEIFRMVKATRDYKNCEKMLCEIPEIKWDSVANSVGMHYYEASDASQLEQQLPLFFAETDKASLLVINTPAGNSETYRNIIKETDKEL